MYTVKQTDLPEGINALTKMVTSPARTVYVVIDDKGNESWECELKVTAEMYAACKNHDEQNGTHLEGALNEYLNQERWAEEDHPNRGLEIKMEKKITMVRDGDHINFVNQNGVAIASLFDHHGHIIFDKIADSRELFGVDSPVDWPSWFAQNGITVQSARLIDLMPNPSKTEPLMKISVKFYSGDLNNGNINSFDTYEEAYANYKEMAESCATTDRGDELDATPEEALGESMDFHYVQKVTTTFDEDGEIVKEETETIDGGVE